MAIDLSHWRYVESLTLIQAACLFASVRPAETRHQLWEPEKSGKVEPWRLALTDAVVSGELPADNRAAPTLPDDYDASRIKRSDLVDLARKKDWPLPAVWQPHPAESPADPLASTTFTQHPRGQPATARAIAVPRFAGSFRGVGHGMKWPAVDNPARAAPRKGGRSSWQRKAVEKYLDDAYPGGVPPDVTIGALEAELKAKGIVASARTIRRAMGRA